MSSRPNKHRCFKIPRDKLNLFLVALDVNFSSSLIEQNVDYVFIADDNRFYDVIVAQYGSYPHLENRLAEFADKLSEELCKHESTIIEYTHGRPTYPIKAKCITCGIELKAEWRPLNE